MNIFNFMSEENEEVKQPEANAPEGGSEEGAVSSESNG